MNRGAILITARVQSERLKEKHLRQIGGKPILQYLVNRVNFQFAEEIENEDLEVCIATGDRESNLRLGAEIKDVELTYGDPRNIPKRHLDAAKLLGASYVISVDGDDVFCSTLAMRAMHVLLQGGVDLARTEGLPLGLNASGYSVDYLEKKVGQANQRVLETGWGRIFDEKDYVTVHFPAEMMSNVTGKPYLRFTLDYPEDLEFFRKIIEHVKSRYIDVSDVDLVKLVIDNELYEITDPIAKKYWDNFNKQREEEMIGMRDR